MRRHDEEESIVCLHKDKDFSLENQNTRECPIHCVQIIQTILQELASKNKEIALLQEEVKSKDHHIFCLGEKIVTIIGFLNHRQLGHQHTTSESAS